MHCLQEIYFQHKDKNHLISKLFPKYDSKRKKLDFIKIKIFALQKTQLRE